MHILTFRSISLKEQKVSLFRNETVYIRMSDKAWKYQSCQVVIDSLTNYLYSYNEKRNLTKDLTRYSKYSSFDGEEVSLAPVIPTSRAHPGFNSPSESYPFMMNGIL